MSIKEYSDEQVINLYRELKAINKNPSIAVSRVVVKLVILGEKKKLVIVLILITLHVPLLMVVSMSTG